MSGIVVVKAKFVKEHIEEFEKLVVAMNNCNPSSLWTLDQVVMVSAINGIEKFKETYSDLLEEENA